MQIDISSDRIERLARVIRETTSDEMLKCVGTFSDEELVRTAVEHCVGVTSEVAAVFPRKLCDLYLR
jgi:hypothetical protein